MDYQTICRTCLGESKEMWHIESTISIGGEHVQLSAILEQFYNYAILPHDQLPDNLCVNCVHQLTITYSFKLLIAESAKKLTKMLVADDDCDQYEVDYNNSDDDNMFLDIELKKDENDLDRFHLSSFRLAESDESNMKRNQSEQTKSNQREEIKSAGQRQTKSKDDNETFYCVECKAKFRTVKFLKQHCIEKHPVAAPQVGETGKVCVYCNKKLKDYRAFMLHKELHITPYFCENCWIGFNSSNEFNWHSCEPNEENVRRKTKDLRQCEICGKYCLATNISKHRMSHSDETRYSCSFCPKKFKTHGQMWSHELWNHKRTRNYECEVCSAKFISAGARSSHVRRHHLKIRRHGCHVCGKRFFLKTELAKHSVSHTGIKNYQCEVCGKSYRTREGLKLHKIRTNHSDPLSLVEKGSTN